MEQIMDSRVLRGWHMAPNYSQAGHPPPPSTISTLQSDLFNFYQGENSPALLVNFSPCFPLKVASVWLQIIPSADPSQLLVAEILNLIISFGDRATSYTVHAFFVFNTVHAFFAHHTSSSNTILPQVFNTMPHQNVLYCTTQLRSANTVPIWAIDQYLKYQLYLKYIKYWCIIRGWANHAELALVLLHRRHMYAWCFTTMCFLRGLLLMSACYSNST